MTQTNPQNKTTVRYLICQYCGGVARLKKSGYIYSKKLFNNKPSSLFYVCENFPSCNTYIACVNDTTIPHGTLANKELRRLRQLCHTNFDLIWKTGVKKTRAHAYLYLQRKMNLSKRLAHISMFNEEQCLELLNLLKDSKTYKKALKRFNSRNNYEV